MSGALLWPIAGAAGASLARATTAAVQGSMAFATELAKGIGAAPKDVDAETKTAAAERQESLKRRIEQLAERIRQQLEAAGIDMSQPLSLTSDGLGGISAGDHPQRAAIESLLESDVLLLRDFERLADEHQSLATTEFSVVVGTAESSHG